jgi:hypothetical protein
MRMTKIGESHVRGSGSETFGLVRIRDGDARVVVDRAAVDERDLHDRAKGFAVLRVIA